MTLGFGRFLSRQIMIIKIIDRLRVIKRTGLNSKSPSLCSTRNDVCASRFFSFLEAAAVFL